MTLANQPISYSEHNLFEEHNGLALKFAITTPVVEGRGDERGVVNDDDDRKHSWSWT
ncbi:unnamed protein product [Dovyalis caffra]|uniref:Uncharacterized protein n=1 Tax=Dovyalis caffra TaxID=77055 RepID=A0AAV1QZF4_9ROSI|nr:unnamed protein product [Dovyalis caffra]